MDIGFQHSVLGFIPVGVYRSCFATEHHLMCAGRWLGRAVA